MRKTVLLFVLPMLLLLPSWRAQAQLVPAKHEIPTNDPGMKLGFQTLVQAQKKVLPGLEAGIGAELRMQGDFLFDKQWRLHGDLEYKLAKRFALTGEYTLIHKHRDGDRSSVRHRAGIGLKETLKFSKKAKLTFTERLQWTHRVGDMNKYQSARDQVAVKLKGKLTCTLSRKIDLFFSLEGRISLREPNLTYIYYDRQLWQYTDAAGSPVGERGWFLDGFNKVSMNRARSSLGATYALNKRHKIQLSILADHDRELQIDSDKKGIVIKSLVNDRRVTVYGRLAYTFSL